MKRKIVALLLLIFVSSSLLFGAIGIYETERSHSFAPFALMSPRVVGMGGTGLALTGTMESRLMNPANSPESFGLSLPYASVTLYNIKNNKDNLMEIATENQRLSVYDMAFSLLNSIPSGERNFLSIDLGAGLSLKNLSFFTFVNADIFTFGEGDLSSTIGVDVDSGFNVALSYEYDWENDYSLAVGLGLSGLYKNITAGSDKLSGIGVDFVSNVFEEWQDDTENIMDALMNALMGIPQSLGEAYPLSIGVRADFPYGFSLALGLNNINGNYRMKVLDSSETYTIKVPSTLDFGFGWTLDAGKLWYHLLQPTVAIDIVDIIGMFHDGIFNKGIFVDHLKMGAELNLLTVLSARCGLDCGYFTFGIGADIYALNVDLSYGVRPYGPSREGRYLDYVKLRINLGYDRP